MLKILIVDDNSDKIRKIIGTINEFPEGLLSEIDTALDSITAKKNLKEKLYDLLILDLFLPERIGGEAKKTGGASLLAELSASIALHKPFHIIGLTAFEELKTEFSEQFLNEVWLIIEYNESSDNWKRQLKNKIKYLIQSKTELKFVSAIDYDLGIVTALPELELKSVLNLNTKWEKICYQNDPTVYYTGIFSNDQKKLKVVVASTPQMGMTAAAVLAMKIIDNFHPHFLVTVGIAAGIKGEGNIGDILVSDLSWDYNSGKIKCDQLGNVKFLPDPKSLSLDASLKSSLMAVQVERRYLDDIKSRWRGPAPDSSLNLRIGPVATGAAVVENEWLIREIQSHHRKLIGIDMESYGIFYAALNSKAPRPIPLSIKSISDFADSTKSDEFQAYAAFTSSQFLYYFALDTF